MGKLKPWVAFSLICFTVSTVHSGTDFDQRLAEARRQYFANLQGDHAAGDKARASFAALTHDYPEQPVVEAYSGSLELLEAARTWAIWDKRRLANEGLQKIDQAVNRAPKDLEARFIRAASCWHLPFFYKRKEQAASDFAVIAPQAEAAAARGTLPPSWPRPRLTTTVRSSLTAATVTVPNKPLKPRCGSTAPAQPAGMRKNVSAASSGAHLSGLRAK